MNKEITYRNIAYIGGLILIFGLFINFSSPIKKGIFDVFYGIIALLTFTFSYLWLKKRILLIGLLLYTIGFNIELLFNPLIEIDTKAFLTPILKWIGIIFQISSIIFLLLGFWDKIENKYISKTTDIGIKQALTIVIIMTGIFQFIFQII